MDDSRVDSGRTRWGLLALLSVLYLGGAALLALRRPLWNDELYTLLIADSPTMADVWAALATGADQVPPPFHVVVRAFFAALGTSAFALRLPSVVGFWLMGLSLYAFVARRTSPVYGAVAMAFPLITGAFDYAHEGRAYALALGFTALALASWQAASEPARRSLALAGVALGIAGAVSSHYYAALVVGPLALAEAVRWASERRIRLGVPLAFGVGLTPLLCFLPLIGAARTYSVSFWARPEWSHAAITYFVLLLPSGPALWAMIALAAIHPRGRMAALDPPAATPARFTPAELAGAGAFALLPIGAVVLGILVTGVFTPRYALAGVIGIAVLAGLGAHAAFAGRRLAGIALVAISVVWFVALTGRTLNTASVTARRGADCERLLAAAEPALPIAVADPLTFLKLSYTLPEELRRRVVYLADAEAALRHLGHNTVDRGLVDLEPWFDARVEPFRTFLETTPRFLLLARTTDAHGEIWRMGWILAELSKMPVEVTLGSRSHDDLLFVVEAERP